MRCKADLTQHMQLIHSEPFVNVFPNIHQPIVLEREAENPSDQNESFGTALNFESNIDDNLKRQGQEPPGSTKRFQKAPIFCNICGKRSSRRDNLIRHIKLQHGITSTEHKESNTSIATTIVGDSQFLDKEEGVQSDKAPDATMSNEMISDNNLSSSLSYPLRENILSRKESLSLLELPK